eukprot:TRINITY_DN1463_c0_g1_i10.p1 TRINITY_DN1463_c0_g1~~TRINITY_DN1463_c0_g1_i10.p1  ORF type:complete len:217 (-),score=6.86 TRINITY_DN1463_c0_g1_i10:1167-1817(-)
MTGLTACTDCSLDSDAAATVTALGFGRLRTKVQPEFAAPACILVLERRRWMRADVPSTLLSVASAMQSSDRQRPVYVRCDSLGRFFERNGATGSTVVQAGLAIHRVAFHESSCRQASVVHPPPILHARRVFGRECWRKLRQAVRDVCINGFASLDGCAECSSADGSAFLVFLIGLLGSFDSLGPDQTAKTLRSSDSRIASPPSSDTRLCPCVGRHD